MLDKIENDLEDGRVYIIDNDHYTLADIVMTILLGRMHLIEGTAMFGPYTLDYWKRQLNRKSF